MKEKQIKELLKKASWYASEATYHDTNEAKNLIKKAKALKEEAFALMKYETSTTNK